MAKRQTTSLQQLLLLLLLELPLLLLELLTLLLLLLRHCRLPLKAQKTLLSKAPLRSTPLQFSRRSKCCRALSLATLL